MNNIEYWIDLAQYDLETARAMRDTRRYLYVGFMCHQVIEKALKAGFSKIYDEVPPYTHNLAVLADRAEIISEMSNEQKGFLFTLNPLYINTRYPADKEKILKSLTKEKCDEILLKTEELLLWIIAKL